MKKSILCLFITLLLVSCTRDEPIISELNIVWEQKYTDILAGSIPPTIVGEKVIVSRSIYDSNNYPHSPLVAFDKNTGEQKWEWSDFTGNVHWFFSNDLAYTYEKYLLFNGYATVYCIDTKSGQTVWRNRDEAASLDETVTGYEDKIYYASGTGDDSRAWIKEEDVITGSSRKVFELNQTTTYKPRIQAPEPYLNQNGDFSLVVTYSMYDIAALDARYYWSIYNTRLDSFIYVKNITDSTGSGSIGKPVITDGKSYFGIGNMLFCYDIETGERLWDNWIEGKIGFTGYMVQGDKVYCGSEGYSPSLYCFDVETGQQLWKTRTSGTSSWMSIYNNTIYFTGGGDGKLHAIDAISGNYVGKYDAPKAHEDSDLTFLRAMSQDLETGRIYTTDFKNVYCIEAVR